MCRNSNRTRSPYTIIVSYHCLTKISAGWRTAILPEELICRSTSEQGKPCRVGSFFIRQPTRPIIRPITNAITKRETDRWECIGAYDRETTEEICAISRLVTSRHRPGWRSPSTTGPIATRTSLNVGCPTAAVMRRTCRFNPSWSVISSQAVGTFLRKRMGTGRSGSCGSFGNRRTPAGLVLLPFSTTPFCNASNASSFGIRSTCTRYTFDS